MATINARDYQFSYNMIRAVVPKTERVRIQITRRHVIMTVRHMTNNTTLRIAIPAWNTDKMIGLSGMVPIILLPILTPDAPVNRDLEITYSVLPPMLTIDGATTGRFQVGDPVGMDDPVYTWERWRTFDSAEALKLSQIVRFVVPATNREPEFPTKNGYTLDYMRLLFGNGRTVAQATDGFRFHDAQYGARPYLSEAFPGASADTVFHMPRNAARCLAALERQPLRVDKCTTDSTDATAWTYSVPSATTQNSARQLVITVFADHGVPTKLPAFDTTFPYRPPMYAASMSREAVRDAVTFGDRVDFHYDEQVVIVANAPRVQELRFVPSHVDAPYHAVSMDNNGTALPFILLSARFIADAVKRLPETCTVLRMYQYSQRDPVIFEATDGVSAFRAMLMPRNNQLSRHIRARLEDAGLTVPAES